VLRSPNAKTRRPAIKPDGRAKSSRNSFNTSEFDPRPFYRQGTDRRPPSQTGTILINLAVAVTKVPAAFARGRVGR